MGLGGALSVLDAPFVLPRGELPIEEGFALTDSDALFALHTETGEAIRDSARLRSFGGAT